MRLLCISLLLAVCCMGDTLEIWQAADAPVVDRGRVFVVLHTQFRTRPNLRDYYQARVGPIVRVQLSNRYSLIGGYYYGEIEQKVAWGNQHRTFGGIEAPMRWGGQVLTLRTMIEQHFGGQDRQEVRFRQQVQIVRNLAGPVEAILGAEAFFDQDGYFQQRSTGGVRLPFIGKYRLDVTYHYDARLKRAGQDRHVIQAAFRPGRRER